MLWLNEGQCAFSQTECCHFRLAMVAILPCNAINQPRPLNAQPESTVAIAIDFLIVRPGHWHVAKLNYLHGI